MNDLEIIEKFNFFQFLAYSEWIKFNKSNNYKFWTKYMIFVTWKRFYFNLITRQIPKF